MKTENLTNFDNMENKNWVIDFTYDNDHCGGDEDIVFTEKFQELTFNEVIKKIKEIVLDEGEAGYTIRGRSNNGDVIYIYQENFESLSITKE
jgi:hypothetical protein